MARLAPDSSDSSDFSAESRATAGGGPLGWREGNAHQHLRLVDRGPEHHGRMLGTVRGRRRRRVRRQGRRRVLRRGVRLVRWRVRRRRLAAAQEDVVRRGAAVANKRHRRTIRVGRAHMIVPFEKFSNRPFAIGAQILPPPLRRSTKCSVDSF